MLCHNHAVSDSSKDRPAPLAKEGIKYLARAQVFESGTRFTTPLLYLADGPDLLVVASQGGTAKDPQWFHNLRTQPETQVQVGADLRRVPDRLASASERAALWPRPVELYADFETYQTWTDREIPALVLSPR